MEYSFNVGLAIKLGLDESIFLENLVFWLLKNKANENNYYDKRYWTYNSNKAYSQLFPFWSERQIRRIILSLINQNVIVTGNYNPNNYDRTLWYALTDDYEYLLDIKNDKSILPNVNFHFTKRSNGNTEKVKSLYTDNKPNKKPYIYNNENFEKYSSIINEWFEYKKSRGQPYKSEKSKQLLLKKIIELSGDSVEVAQKIIEQSIANNWSGLFELKNNTINNFRNPEGKRTVGVEPTKDADYTDAPPGWIIFSDGVKITK